MSDDSDDLLDPFESRGVDRRRPLRERRFRKVPFRFIVPNVVTLVALCLGLTAIRFAADGRFELAVFTILLAAVFDGLDGRIARALKGTTRFGSFNTIKSLGWFTALVFAIACALRLARFNVALDDADKPAWSSHFFTGMPAPAGAIVSLLPLYLHYSILGEVTGRGWVLAQIVYVLAIAGLMASRIPHFSGKTIGRIPREQVILVLFGVAILILLLATFTMEVLAVLTLAYLAMIPFSVRRQRAYLEADLKSRGPREPVAP